MPVSESPPIVDYIWTEGNRVPEIGFTLPAGALVSAFTITLGIERPDGTELSIAATDLGGSRGSFPWLAADLITGARQRCQIHRTEIATGLPQSSQLFLINVRSKIGS